MLPMLLGLVQGCNAPLGKRRKRRGGEAATLIAMQQIASLSPAPASQLLSPVPIPDPMGGGQDGAGSGAGIGAGALLAGAFRFGAAFLVTFLDVFFADAFIVFFFLRAGAVFFLALVFLFAFFAMIVLPFIAGESVGPAGDRIALKHSTREAEERRRSAR
jgi:hypothetical protein